MIIHSHFSNIKEYFYGSFCLKVGCCVGLTKRISHNCSELKNSLKSGSLNRNATADATAAIKKHGSLNHFPESPRESLKNNWQR